MKKEDGTKTKCKEDGTKCVGRTKMRYNKEKNDGTINFGSHQEEKVQ